MVLNEFNSMGRSARQAFLKEDYQPGDLKFTDINEETLGSQMDKELNNGRLAMMVQELVTGHQL